MKTLIAGVGYRNLGDLSFGPALVDELADLEWPPDVQIEDLSYGPIAVLQWLQEQEGAFRRGIFVSAAVRDRVPGTLHQYPWRGCTEDADGVQARVAEALTAVISLDNLLVICEHFGALPREVSVIEVEPVEQGWGPNLSAIVSARLLETVEILRAEAGLTAGLRKR